MIRRQSHLHVIRFVVDQTSEPKHIASCAPLKEESGTLCEVLNLIRKHVREDGYICNSSLLPQLSLQSVEKPIIIRINPATGNLDRKLARIVRRALQQKKP